MWPIAPGWWILALLTLAALIAGSMVWYRHTQRRRWYKLATRHLLQIKSDFMRQPDAHHYLHHLIALSKSVARHKKLDKVLSHSAPEWINFLAHEYPQSGFDSQDAQLAEEILYRPPQQSLSERQLTQLRRWPEKLQAWLKALD